MFSWFKKKPKEEPYVPRKGSVGLSVYMKDGTYKSWHVILDEPLWSKDEYFAFFEEFTTWWCSGKESFFIMRSAEGECMFLRESVKRYEISIVEPEVIHYADNVIPLKP